MRVDFYHLTAAPIERVLPRIGERLVEGGKRLLIVAGGELLGRLDEALWSYEPDSFLPHGNAAAPHPDRQPILLSPEPAAVNGARNIALADGIWREAALGFERAFHFFDGARLDGARACWRALKSAGEAELRYWRQDERGRWAEGP